MRLAKNEHTAREQKREFLKAFRLGIQRVFVAVAEPGKIVGYMVGSLNPKNSYLANERTANIDDAFVATPYRRKGIGERLFLALFRWFKAKGVDRIAVTVNARNETAVWFWKRHGFKEVNKQFALEL